MTREHKLALIVGFSLVLVLGVLISDHFSKARSAPLAVEIRESSKPPFNSGLALASPQSPEGMLPSSQPQSPTRALEPLPDRGGGGTTTTPSQPIPKSTQPQPFEMAMGDHRETRPALPTTSLTNMSQSPIAGPSGPMPDTALPISGGALKRYDVKGNDNIYSVAKKYYGDGNLWTKLRDYNKGKVTESGGMKEGVTLDIPPKDVLDGKARLGDLRLTGQAGSLPGVPSQQVTGLGKTDSAPAKLDAKADPKTDASAAKAGYVVQDGDTLYSIARKKLGSTKRVQDLVDANKGLLDSPDELKVGMSIRIPSR